MANRKDLADVAVEFVKVDEASKEEIERLERLNVLIKEKHIPIANLDLRRPGQVAKDVEAKLPHKFTVSSHPVVWQHFKVRPQSGSAKPEITDSKYCVYDPAHNDYLYTGAWVEKLARELSDPSTFESLTGMAPVQK